MLNHEQRLLAAAMRYLAQLDTGDLISIEAFAAAVDPDLRAELVPYLRNILDSDIPQEPIILTPAEQALAERVTTSTLVRIAALRAAPAQTLTAVRTAHQLSLNALAQHIDLPVDLLARIERGGVAINSLPGKLITRLATVLSATEAQIHAALQLPPTSWANTSPQLHESPAMYTTQPAPSESEQVITFADALLRSTATPEQRSEWQTE